MRRARLLCGFARGWAVCALLGAGWGGQALAQKPAPPPEPAAPITLPDTLPQPEPLPPAQGQVIIQSHGNPPPAPGETGYGTEAAKPPQEPVADQTAKADLTDADRSALLISSYDLDARLSPARSGLSVRAQLTVRNDGPNPLKQLALQISSTLHWDSATLLDGATRTHLALAQHQLDTDADHTGSETEAILPLPQPLAPGASVSLDLFYSGTIPQSAARLGRLGANAAQQGNTDWDAISPSWTGIRGFGDVLWYPVATPQLFLAEGNALFEAIGRTRLREERARTHLRLSVEYTGGAPAAAYFCGRRQVFKAVADDPDASAAAGSGIATAEFSAEPLGFRTPSLFVLQLPESFPGSATTGAAGDSAADSSATPGSSSSSSSSSSSAPVPAETPKSAQTVPSASAGEPPFLAVVTGDAGAAEGFGAAADHVAPLLREWLGARPLSALTAIDHEGQPFQDGPLLVAPIAVLAGSPDAPALVQSLTHAWVQTGQPWMDEGLGQFFSLLWVEREGGRDAAIAQLGELMRPVTIAEPDPTAAPNANAGDTGNPKGEPLVTAADDLFYRRKAAAVWWMLRGIVGDGNLHQALSAWRIQPASGAPAAEQAVAFEHLLEKLSGKDLGWFFADWVLRDRGLPDLSISELAAAPETTTPGHPNGWLVAVTVRNEGGAVADVPLIIRSGPNRIEQRMRIPALSTVTQRVLVETSPTGVQVNDGSTPEVSTSVHTRDINLQVR